MVVLLKIYFIFRSMSLACEGIGLAICHFKSVINFEVEAWRNSEQQV
jgi:hypothetical protein